VRPTNTGVRGNERERDIYCSPHKKWEQRLKMAAPISESYPGELGEHVWSKSWVWVAGMAVKTGRGHSGPWGDFLDLGHCLVKRDIEFLL
jgi:hypothetical protein